MRLPVLNNRGVVPILPIIGLIVLAIGITVAIQLVTNTEQDIRSSAAETLGPRATESPSPKPTNQKNFRDLLE